MAEHTTSLRLQIVTRERQLTDDSVDEVQIRGRDGYLGILPGHAPLITELGSGEMSYRKGGERHFLALINGFAEVLPDRVIVLAEVAERAEEVDADRARASKERAEKRMANPKAPDLDWDRASFALHRALIRLQVAAKGGAPAAEGEQHHPTP